MLTKMNFMIGFLALALGAFSVIADAEPAKASAASSLATEFVQKMGDKALSSLTAKDLPRRERERKVRELLRAHFDLPTISRFAMGPYWRQATDMQKKEYADLFEDMIVKTYTLRFEEYSGQILKVVGAMATGGKDSIVSSQILQDDGPAINIEWRVRDKDGQMKVVDVIVESISMSVTQRSDFAAVIQRGGGSIEVLLETLRNRKNGAI